MRLHHLWIAEFRNLRDVTIDLGTRPPDFYGSLALSFFVGTNGSGKSNALDAIGTIFSHLDAEIEPPFAFDIDYELRGQRVRFCTAAHDRHGGRPLSGVDLVLMTRPANAQRDWHSDDAIADAGVIRDVLPARVIGQSSGFNSSLGMALERSVERLLVERERGSEAALAEEDLEIRRTTRQVLLRDRSIMFLDASDAMLAALAALAHASGDDRLHGLHTTLDEIGLNSADALVAFSMTLANDWEQRVAGDALFRLERLVGTAATAAPVSSFRQDAGDADHRLTFDGATASANVDAWSLTTLRLFDDLVAWHRAGAITDVALVLRKAGVSGVVTHRDLSDGEYAYLTRYALLAMALEVPDTLLLFDEIESHFNAAWCMDLVRRISELSHPEAATELVLATHSDIVLTDADPTAVVHFVVTDREDGTVTTAPAPIPTLAASREELASRFFGVEGGIGSFGLSKAASALKGGVREIDALLPLLGPGLSRFRLERKRQELEDT